MTLVNTETGELLDAEAAERRASYICTDLDSAADSFESAMDRMRAAIRDRDDIALGYRSPGDYLSDRFGGRLARLGVDLRREVVRELTEAGLSTRAIAPVVGTSFKTVARDIAAPVSGDTPQTPSSAPPVADEEHAPEGEAAPAPDIAVSVPSTERNATSRPPVTGIDGKTYSRPAPTPKPERSGEQQNAEENSRTLASALIFLLAFQHPNQRDTARTEWEVGRWAVSPTNRGFVTPNHMREVAAGLSALADEWENTHE